MKPQLMQTVLDAREIRPLAEFYRELLGWSYRPGDEIPVDRSDDADWLVLLNPHGDRGLAFQQSSHHARPTWPSPDVPQQLHLDLTVPDRESLAEAHDHVLALGGEVLLERTADPDEPLWVFADPAGHPFCVFIA